MKIAVLSDIHDNFQNLTKALQIIKQEKCETIIFCGDYCSPSAFKKLAESGIKLFAIFGNVDGAKYEIMKAIMENNYKIEQKNDLLEIELDDKKIAVCHKPEFAEGLAATGKYDVVFYGHTHMSEQKKIDKTLLANPGEIHGGLGKCSFGVYDTTLNKFKIIEVK